MRHLPAWLAALLLALCANCHHARAGISDGPDGVDPLDFGLAIHSTCNASDAIRSAEIEGGLVDQTIVDALRRCELQTVYVHARGTRAEADEIVRKWVVALGRYGTLNSCDSLKDCAKTVDDECTKALCGNGGSAALTADTTGRSTYNNTNCTGTCLGAGKCAAGTKIIRYCITYGPILQK